MNRQSIFTLAALIAFSLSLPVISQAKMNRGETRSFSSDRHMDQQTYRQDRVADRQQMRNESRQVMADADSLQERQQVRSETRTQTREYQAEGVADNQDFIRERRQDHLQLQQDIVD